MRNRYMISAALLLVASAFVAGAQQQAASSTDKLLGLDKLWGLGPPSGKLLGLEQRWELGFRSTTTTGDEARYQRYQDLSNGLASKIWFGKETNASAFDFSAANVGYNDQAYALKYNKFGKMKFTADYTGQPLNYANNTLTPYKYAGNNVWTLNTAARTSVQAATPGVIGIGTTAATDVATIFRPLATTFPMSSQRDKLNIGLSYRLNDWANVDVKYGMTKKTGNQPWGAAFAFNDATNIPMELDNTVNEFTAGLEAVKKEWGMVRAEYQSSSFKNQFPSLTWDNPLRATDYFLAKAYSIVPPAAVGGAWVLNGPWDNSGYSNGRGPAFGRLSLPPSSQMNAFRLSGLYKMPNHTTLNGQFSFTRMTQDEALLPFTANTTIANAATFAAIPGLARLPRASAEAQVQGINGMLNFATRPTEFFAFDMKYRFNDHNNQTPFYDYSYNVRFDAVPEYVPGEGTEQLDIRQNTMEAGATFMVPHQFTALKFGYIMDDVKRAGRAFGDMTDYTLRTSLDAYQNKYGSVRAILENTRRIGSGFDLMAIEDGGAQDGLRFYDDADMDRAKATLVLSLTPIDKFDVNVTVATLDDEYKGEGHEFGLLQNKTTSYNLSANVYATDRITLGGNYGMDKMTTNQKSRNANPPSGVVGAYESWDDPKRDWFLDNEENVKTVGVWVDLIKAFPNTDIRVGYNYSNSDNALDLNGPRTLALKSPDNLSLRDPRDLTRPCAAGITLCFLALPNVTNTWSQIKVDLRHMFRSSMGVGLGYQYEKLDIVDFATTDVTPGVPRMDPLGALTTGYGNRPYTGSTMVAKLIYMW